MQRFNQRKTSRRSAQLTSRWRAWLLAAPLVLLVLVVYWPTLANGFVWDDDDYVENNATLASPSGLLNIWFKLGAVPQYYPLAHSTFWLEHRLWGLDPRGYHVVNMLLHAASVVLVWRLLARLAVPGAWLAAAIFAVHPVEVESVAWITERKNVLSCTLALGSLLAYLRFSPPERAAHPAGDSSSDRETWLYYGLALGLYTAALLSKTVTASVPAVLLVIYWWKRGQVTRRDLAPLAPFFVVGLALAAVTIWMEKTHVGASGAEWNLSPLARLLVAGRALWFYAGKLAWPHPIIFFYPRWIIDTHAAWQYLFPAAAVAVVVALWFARQRTGRGPLAAVLIFAGVLVPALGFFDVFPFRYSFVADHFQYHAGIALIALAAAAITVAGRRFGRNLSWLTPLAAAGLLLALVAVAEPRTRVYKDRFTLHEDTLARNPDAWVAPADLGHVLLGQGQYDPAIAYDRRTIGILRRLISENPGVVDYVDLLAGNYVNLGVAQQKGEQMPGALDSYRRAIEIRQKLVNDHPEVPEYRDRLAHCFTDLAVALRAAGQPIEAVDRHHKALEIRERLVRDFPKESNYQNNVAESEVDLGLLARQMGRSAEADDWFEKALVIREKLVQDYPASSQYENGLAWCYMDLGCVRNDVGRVSDAAGSFRKAAESRERLVRANPTVTEYQAGLAASYEELATAQQSSAHPTEAEAAHQRAIEVRETLVRENPRAAVHQGILAWDYERLGTLRYRAGRPADAERDLLRTLEIREKLVRDNPTVADFQNDLGWIHIQLGDLQRAAGRPTEAIASCNQAIDLLEKLVAKTPDTARYRANLGLGYAIVGASQHALRQYAEAEASYRKAASIREKLAEDFPAVADYQQAVATTYEELAALQRNLGQPAEAEYSLQKAAKIRERIVHDRRAVGS